MKTPLTDHLLEYLCEEYHLTVAYSLTTLMHEGQVAQEWLLTKYLAAWLNLIGGCVDAGYPLALRHGRALRAIQKLELQIDAARDVSDQVFFLRGVEDSIKGVARFCGVPDERSMQWGVWGRDVPIAMAYGFSETEVLSPLICEGIAPCCMYAAFLVSLVVTDEGTAEEIADRMFEVMPRELLDLLQRLPAAPEA